MLICWGVLASTMPASGESSFLLAFILSMQTNGTARFLAQLEHGLVAITVRELVSIVDRAAEDALMLAQAKVPPRFDIRAEVDGGASVHIDVKSVGLHGAQRRKTGSNDRVAGHEFFAPTRRGNPTFILRRPPPSPGKLHDRS